MTILTPRPMLVGNMEHGMIEQFDAALPAHECELMLSHNPHKNNYETVEDYEEQRQCRRDWVSDEQREKAIATQAFWELQWYPDTPVGFCLRLAADLPALLAPPFESR